MNTFISMLRGINVGGQKRLRMETLRGLYEELGFINVRTYVQSGNVVFDSSAIKRSELVGKIEAHLQNNLDYHVDIFIRQADDMQRILSCNPFLMDRIEDPSKCLVTFYYQAPSETVLSKLIAPAGITDEFALSDMEAYIFCPIGYGKTKLSNSFFERKLGIPVTTRNWNTVNALYKMAVEK
jgi:uncharacterized protein (DUF1697 family)